MALVGDSILMTAVFRDGTTNLLVDPDTVSVLIELDGEEVLISTPVVPEHISEGRYRITLSPEFTGVYTVTVTGTFSGSSDIVISQDFVITDGSDTSIDPSLGVDVVITFSSGFDPLLVDPESLLPYIDNEDVTPLDIAKLVHKFSLEVHNLFPTGNYPPVAMDYIHASVLCALTRIYEGIGGASSYSGFTLGDLQVMDSGGGKSSGSGNRGNIGSWCELAELLRMEMRNFKGGMTSAVKAGRWRTPIPDRQLHRAGTKPRRRRY